MMTDDDLDDLFVDAPQLHLPPPVSKGLLQCVDDLRLSGCCQYVSESQGETTCPFNESVGRLPGPSMAVSRTSRRMVDA